MWQISRERCGLIYGPAAAILQIAHPWIEQGVHNHTNFRTDIMGRLRRTLESTNRIVFGRVSESRRPNERRDRQLWPRYLLTPIGNEPGSGMDSRRDNVAVTCANAVTRLSRGSYCAGERIVHGSGGSSRSRVAFCARSRAASSSGRCFSAQRQIASRGSMRLCPSGVSEYSTIGGTTG
jgi:hypothetical protein